MERDNFYSTTTPTKDLLAYQLCWTIQIAPSWVGKLTETFNKTFSTYDLLLRKPIELARRDHLEIWIVRSISTATAMDSPTFRLIREEEAAMRNFINGFLAACKTFQEKK